MFFPETMDLVEEDYIYYSDEEGSCSSDDGSIDDSSQVRRGLMDVVSLDVVQHILRLLSSCTDVATSAAVCKEWRRMVTNVRKLIFGRHIDRESTVTKMILKTTSLEELSVFGPFTPASLQVWINHTKNSLSALELRVDADDQKDSSQKLECISGAMQLQHLKLWGGDIFNAPSGWCNLTNLQTLQIVGARFDNDALRNITLACPALKALDVVGCHGVRTLDVQMKFLEECRLDFVAGPGQCGVCVRAPRLKSLQVQGASFLRVLDDHSLKRLSVAKQGEWTMNALELGKLPVLETLSLRGLRWRWEAISGVVLSPLSVRELCLRIEFCGDRETYDPFPPVDLANFLALHPKLKVLEAHGGWFAAFAPITQSPMPTFPLEEVHLTIRSSLNWQRKYHVLQSFICACPHLKKMVLRTAHMRNDDSGVFFGMLVELQRLHRFILVE